MYEQNELELEILRGTLMPYTKYWDEWVNHPTCFLIPEEVKAIDAFLAYYTGHSEDEEIKLMQLRPHYKRAIQKLQDRYIDFLKYLEISGNRKQGEENNQPH